jgi:TRAP-type C4-dicarboxylate transport system substrate-binding protein
MFDRRPILLAALATAVTGLAVAGCTPPEVVDQTADSTVVLQLATVDSLNPNGQTIAPQTLIDALDRHSGGRLTAAVQEEYELGEATAETDLVKAIASGAVDGGWPSTRAFSRAGIRGLEPIEAPFTLTSYAAERSLVSGPAVRAVLATLEGSGTVGLGLAVGPLRRPWAVNEPLVDPQSWRGVTFRSFNSPVQDGTVRALGAKPVAASFQFPDLVAAGKLQGVELDVAQYSENDYGNLTPQAVSNEVLWPKMLVLALSQKTFDSLSTEQQGWLRDAAQEAVRASVDFDYEEDSLAARLCSQGVRFVEASPEQLAALGRAVRPVIDGLASDPATASSMAAVQKAAAGFPSADALTVPASCRKS